MLEKLRGEWRTSILDAKRESRTPTCLAAFEHLERHQAHRAAFFAKLAHIISGLGLSNPHEKSALSVEPTHSVSAGRLIDAVKNLRIAESFPSLFKDAQLSLVSLALIEHYSPESEARLMRAGPFSDPIHILDPLYGFVFLPHAGRMRNHCLAIDLWSRHLKSMPSELAEELWKNRADSMLSGGALGGRFLFHDLVPKELDPLKRSTVPEITVDTEYELLDLIDKLKTSASRRFHVDLWFRGQKTDYLVPDRSRIIKMGLTPYSNLRESSLTPSLYRKYDNFLSEPLGLENLVVELGEWVHCARHRILVNPRQSLKPQPPGVGRVSDHGITSYQRGLILQQYGAPSAFLDITSDPLIAAWFAVHNCKDDGDGRLTFEPHAWRGLTAPNCPTIFVFPLVFGLHPYVDLATILDADVALRPSRQRCGLLGGAGNLARNYCARYVGLKIRLGPDFRLSKPVPAEHLFPHPSEDTALRDLRALGLGDRNRRFPITEVTFQGNKA
ncbi:MAG: FRG domain-containing protein [Verrucomicrobiales bacterium]|nr:FRG domain-containing protein [Verrucomicrobiales bacterium]